MDDEVIPDIEDGEIDDYTPLPRPNVGGPTNTAKIGCSDNSGEDDNDSLASESGSGSDSDSPNFRPIKPKIKKKHLASRSVHQPNNRKKYNVWCTDVQETALTEELINCDVRPHKIDRSRDVESYDYKLAHTMEEEREHNFLKLTESEDKQVDTMEEEQEQNTNTFKIEPRDQSRGLKRRHDQRRNVKLRLGPRPGDNESKGSARVLDDLIVTLNSTSEEVASDIANKLCEEKDFLILRVVEVLGKEKAIDIFRETKEIEENGGMLIFNRSRRRTPGGVYLLLVKKYSGADDRQQIFDEEVKKGTKQKKKSIKALRKEKTEELRRSLSADGLLGERDIPTLLTRSDLVLEQHKKLIETDGEAAVTNPPPSPATDGRENSSDGVPELSEQLNNRQLNNYEDDDFLDVTCDNMDIF